MEYLSKTIMCVLRITVFLYVLTRGVTLLPVPPGSVQEKWQVSVPNSLPIARSHSSPVVHNTELSHLVQYTAKSSGQSQLPQGAQHLPNVHSRPQSAKPKHKPNDLKSVYHSPIYSDVHAADSTNTHSLHTSISNQIEKHSRNSQVGGSKTITAQIIPRNSQVLQYHSEQEHVGINIDVTPDISGEYNQAELDVKTEKNNAIQLAVKSDLQSNAQGQVDVHETVITAGTTLAALFSLGVIFGIFSCCCKKKSNADDNNKVDKVIAKGERNVTTEERKVNNERSLADNKNPSQVFNPSDIPTGERDLDDVISFKDKIKALDNKLVIQPSPDKRWSQHSPVQPTNRLSQHSLDQSAKRQSQHSPDQSAKKRPQHSPNPSTNRLPLNSPDTASKGSQNNANMTDSVTGQLRKLSQPKIVVSEEDAIRDKIDVSKSTGDNISKSDTQDDISDKIFDNLSMHSSTSQPFNPDVVIADTDDEEEFADIQRGTVVLKSFQRAKPPRNRSPATRTSKGKIRKSRANLGSPRNQHGRRDNSKDGEPVSTPSSASFPVSMGTSDSKTNSPDKVETAVQKSSSKNNSLEKPSTRKESLDNNVDSPISRSTDFSEFGSMMNRSITSIGSDIVTPMKREAGRNGKYTKNKDSPKRDRKESPAKLIKTKERDITEREKRNESPNRYKKSTDSPVDKRKNRIKDNERTHNCLSSNISEDKAVTNPSVANRLSGIPTNASTNIFYLIDPTVKSKCKSVGDVTADKRTSGDYNKHAHKAVKHKPDENQMNQGDDPAVKRERTYSDPNRKSADMDTIP